MNSVDTLPSHLAERSRLVETSRATAASEADRPGESFHTDGPVLWWIHHAMRVEENPALDVARELATRLGRPLLPVAVVGGRHRFNNDRHLTFALEGLRDLQVRLRRAGLDLAVLVRRPDEPSIVARLARTASLVVTEEMPAAPWPRWLEAIAASTDAPLVAVDASCLVPMSLSRKAPDRAFVFRDRFDGERRGRTTATWPACRAEVETASLPEGSLDLASADDAELAAIVASLDVDHSVGPVFDTPGGSEAGEARWAAFRAKGLKRYARDRNEAVRDGVSRMSAYLHYGMVSPFRIAREAAADGAEKYLDELLIWRELAWHWASRTPDHDSIEALPRWARRTLEDHRGDPRDRIDDETLERGLVGEPVWDLAQRSLRRQGELHNNVRMTWGKAIPGWSASPEEATRRLFDLNHRYALDGCDPSSAGGLLWCLGLFDRPFSPERPVLGAVRGRDPADHAARLDLAAYERRISRPQRLGRSGGSLRVAVVGAGVCGLAAARTLADHGVVVGVFDKGRGPGGRISTRRGPGSRFDHGAPSFTVRDPRFGRVVRAWRDLGIVARWDAEAVRCTPGGAVLDTRSLADDGEFVGVGGMNRIAKHLAEDLELSCGARVERIVRDEEGTWSLSVDGRDPSVGWDAVVVTIPGPQADGLLESSAVEAGEVVRLDMQAGPTSPAWVAMVELARPLQRTFGRLEASPETAETSPWRSIVDQGSKPGRDETPGTAFVLEASEAWSHRHVEADRDAVAEALQRMFAETIEHAFGESVEISTCVAHRWRYARPVARGEARSTISPSEWAGDAAGDPAGEPAGGTGSASILVGGDRCRAGHVEGAWLAGIDLAGVLLRDPKWSNRTAIEVDSSSAEPSLF